MRAVEMLDHQIDLLTRMTNPEVRRAWVRQLADDSFEALHDQAARRGVDVSRSVVSSNTGEGLSNGAASVNAMIRAAQEAAAFHVAHDMTQLVLFSASQLDDLDRIDCSLAPTRSGFVRFEGGIPFNDLRGNRLRVSWIVWGPAVVNFKYSRHDVGEPSEVLAMWMWNDHYAEPDDIANQLGDFHGQDAMEEFSRIYGRWGFIGHGVLPDNMRLGPAWLNAQQHLVAPIEVYDYIPQEFTNINRVIHAFFLLLGQTVTASRSVIPSRPHRRRAQRAGLPQRVTVISLRNVETERKEGESLVEWNHRWVVRGFWRWQVCGQNHQLAQEIEPGKWRARIWIAPYVKGPADKPLIVSDKVYSVHR